MYNISSEERNVLCWLRMYGPLTRIQIFSLLESENVEFPEKILAQLRAKNLIENVAGGFYIGLSKNEKPDLKMIKAMWVLICFLQQTQVEKHKRGEYPSLVHFEKQGADYEIVVYERGNRDKLLPLNLIHVEKKLIIVLESRDEMETVEKYIPENKHLYATLSFDGVSVVPTIRFCSPVFKGEEIDEKYK